MIHIVLLLLCFGLGVQIASSILSPVRAATPAAAPSASADQDGDGGRKGGAAESRKNDADRRRKVAEERARELDMLFPKLRRARDEYEASAIANRIWMAWHRSGDRKVNDLVSLATIYMGEGEYAAALPKLDEAIRRAPGFSEAWNRRATLLFHMGEFDRSLADIEKTLQLEPRHFGALAGRGLIYTARGEFRKALDAFEAALKIHPFLKERKNLIPALRRKLGEQKI
jgi:tetratricopeptide (TPR) repeat protein